MSIIWRGSHYQALYARVPGVVREGFPWLFESSYLSFRMFLQHLHLVLFYLQYYPETTSLCGPPSQQHLAEVVPFWRWRLDGKMREMDLAKPPRFWQNCWPRGTWVSLMGVIDMGQLTLRISFTLGILMPLSYVVIQPQDPWKQQKERKLNFPLVHLVFSTYLMSD